MSMRPSRILLIILAVAVLGFAIFGLLAARVTSMEKVGRPAAQVGYSLLVLPLEGTGGPVGPAGQRVRHESTGHYPQGYRQAGGGNHP